MFRVCDFMSSQIAKRKREGSPLRSGDNRCLFSLSWTFGDVGTYLRVGLVCILSFCAGCTPDLSEERVVDRNSDIILSGTKEKAKGTFPMKISERDPVFVTGKEILKFPNGPCFKLGSLKELGPRYINVNRPTPDREIYLSTLSPLKFVDRLPEGATPVGVNSPVYMLRFDTNLSNLGFTVPTQELEELYLYGADRFLANLSPTSGVLKEGHRLYEPKSPIDVGRWRKHVAQGDMYELEPSKIRDGGVRFYAFSPGGHSIMYYGYDFEKLRLLQIRPSVYVPEPFTLRGHTRPNFQKTDYSARALQYLFDGQLHSEFAITRDYLLSADEIFNTFNRILYDAVIECNSAGLEP